MFGLDLLQETEIFQPREDLLARGEAVDAVQFLRKLHRAFRQSAQVIFVADERETALLIEHADLWQIVPPAHLEVVEVMRRRDLHRARAFFRIGIFVGDDRNPASHQRQDHVLADQARVALIVRMHRDRGIAEHGFGTRGGDHDEGRGVVGTESFAFQRIAQIPETAFDLDLLHLEIGNRGQQLRIPVHQPLVFVDQAFAMQFDEHLHDGARQAFVHGEALARPVAGGAKPLQLIDDEASALGLPLPNALEKFGAAQLAPAGLLALHQLPLDHHLGRDPRVIGARLPQHITSAHPLEAAEDVLQGVVERVPHVQRARHIGWRYHNGERPGIAALGPPGLERPAFLPNAGHAAFDIGGLVVFLNHQDAIMAMDRARKPPERAKSTRPARSKAKIKPDVVAESGPAIGPWESRGREPVSTSLENALASA